MSPVTPSRTASPFPTSAPTRLPMFPSTFDPSSLWTGATSRSRSASQINSYSQVGIRRFLIVAVLDDRTTDQCAFLHGKEFSVGRAQGRLEAAEDLAEPEDIEFVLPFLLRQKDGEGNPVLAIKGSSGRSSIIARILEARTPERAGRYQQVRDDGALENLGIGFPPFHHLCRSDTIPAR